jgi:hypothetical protein
MSGLKRSIQEFFPFVPDYSTWDDWNGNLSIFYSKEAIAINAEEDWAETAASVASLPVFAAYPVPYPYDFDDWQSWAREFTLIINGPSK